MSRYGSADDLAAVMQFMADYTDACDVADVDRVVGLLAGTTLVLPSGEEVRDPAQIRSIYAGAVAHPSGDGKRVTKHHLSNLLVTRTGSRLDAKSYYFIIRNVDGAPTVASSGRYVQVYDDASGELRLTRHEMHPDMGRAIAR